MMGKKRKKDKETAAAQPYTRVTLITQIIMTVFALLFLAPLFIIRITGLPAFSAARITA